VLEPHNVHHSTYNCEEARKEKRQERVGIADYVKVGIAVGEAAVDVGRLVQGQIAAVTVRTVPGGGVGAVGAVTGFALYQNVVDGQQVVVQFLCWIAHLHHQHVRQDQRVTDDVEHHGLCNWVTWDRLVDYRFHFSVYRQYFRKLAHVYPCLQHHMDTILVLQR